MLVGLPRWGLRLLGALATPRIFPGFVRRSVPKRAGLGLDNCRTIYMKPLLLLDLGRIAQRESVPFTRERSKVRSLVRPPLGLNNQRLNEPLPRGCAPEELGHNGGTAFLGGYQKIASPQRQLSPTASVLSQLGVVVTRKFCV
jgi:hypothetical protein